MSKKIVQSNTMTKYLIKTPDNGPLFLSPNPKNIPEIVTTEEVLLEDCQTDNLVTQEEFFGAVGCRDETNFLHLLDLVIAGVDILPNKGRENIPGVKIDLPHPIVCEHDSKSGKNEQQAGLNKMGTEYRGGMQELADSETEEFLKLNNTGFLEKSKLRTKRRKVKLGCDKISKLPIINPLIGGPENMKENFLKYKNPK